MTFIVYLKDLSYFGVAGGNYLLSLFFLSGSSDFKMQGTCK